MPRSLWPPYFVITPVEMLTYRDEHGKRLPAGVLETWQDFKAFAWDRTQTDPLEFTLLKRETGKGRSTLCGHLAILTHCFGLRWSISGDCVQVFFDGAAAPVQESGLVQKSGLALEQESPEKPASPESRTLDSVSTLIKESIKDSNLIGRAVQISGLKPPASRNGRQPTDPRSQHPAIQACRQLAKRYPDTSLYDKIIAAIGVAPDLQRLTDCRSAWVERGYNGNAWTWATEWYVTGVPDRKGKTHAAPNNSGSSHRPNANAPASSPLARTLAGRK